MCVCLHEQEVKSDPVMLLTEDDVKLAPVMVESTKRDKRVERRKKASGRL